MPRRSVRVSTSGPSSGRCWRAARLILALHLPSMLFFNHVLPNSEAQEIRGPFRVLNYLRPALLFSVPAIIFLAGHLIRVR